MKIKIGLILGMLVSSLSLLLSCEDTGLRDNSTDAGGTAFVSSQLASSSSQLSLSSSSTLGSSSAATPAPSSSSVQASSASEISLLLQELPVIQRQGDSTCTNRDCSVSCLSRYCSVDWLTTYSSVVISPVFSPAVLQYKLPLNQNVGTVTSFTVSATAESPTADLYINLNDGSYIQGLGKVSATYLASNLLAKNNYIQVLVGDPNLPTRKQVYIIGITYP